jgi:hypothetical protein
MAYRPPCAGETYFDCPYMNSFHEGDTRIQSLISFIYR